MRQLIIGSAEMAKELYHKANYTIIDQYKRREFHSVEWRDLLELIKLAHYDLTGLLTNRRKSLIIYPEILLKINDLRRFVKSPDLTPEQIQEALTYYNARTDLKKYKTIDEVEWETGEAIQQRLTDRLMYMKPTAFALQQLQPVGTP